MRLEEKIEKLEAELKELKQELKQGGDITKAGVYLVFDELHKDTGHGFEQLT